MVKYNDVSLELRNKIRTYMVIYEDVYGGSVHGILQLDETDIELIQECLQWREIIMTYYKTSYGAYKMSKIGRFYGVRPIEVKTINCDSDGKIDVQITFEVDHYEEESWRDWFEIGHERDGFFEGSMGNIINERTHPQFYKDGKYIFDKE